MGKKIAFLGAGNMAEAMISGILAVGTFDKEDVLCVNTRNENRLMRIVNDYGVVKAEPSDISLADILVFSVKPQDFETAAAMYKPYMRSQQLLISIMAGISFKKLQKELIKMPMIRTMPNMALSVRESVTAYALGEIATDEHAKIAEAIFSPLGIVSKVEESEIANVIGVAGSSPGYFCYMLEAVTAAAIDAGMNEHTASAFALEAFIGTAEMLKMQDITPTELRKRISSKGGTTEAATRSFENDNFFEIVKRAYNICCRKSDELERALEEK